MYQTMIQHTYLFQPASLMRAHTPHTLTHTSPHMLHTHTAHTSLVYACRLFCLRLGAAFFSIDGSEFRVCSGLLYRVNGSQIEPCAKNVEVVIYGFTCDTLEDVVRGLVGREEGCETPSTPWERWQGAPRDETGDRRCFARLCETSPIGQRTHGRACSAYGRGRGDVIVSYHTRETCWIALGG